MATKQFDNGSPSEMVTLHVDVASDLPLKAEGKLLLVKKTLHIPRILSTGSCYFKNYLKLEETDLRLLFTVTTQSS